ncbi:MAG: sensor histidine kinase [Gemmatimonadota bacterium]
MPKSPKVASGDHPTAPSRGTTAALWPTAALSLCVFSVVTVSLLVNDRLLVGAAIILVLLVVAVYIQERVSSGNAVADSVADELTSLREQNAELQDLLRRHTGELTTSQKELVQEIRRREAAQDASSLNESRLRQIIDLVPHWIFAKDDFGTIVLANEAVARAYGVTLKEMIGRKDTAFLSNSVEVRRARETDDIVFADDTLTHSYEEDIHLASGETRIFQTSKVALKTANSDRRAVVGVSIDITERKRAEDEVRALNSDLEERVRARTAELAAANRELESFAYSVSHDLRSPLRGIDGWSLALLEDYGNRLDERGLGYLTWVRTEVQRMGRLIDDLLALSRLGRAELRFESVHLSELVDDQIKRMQSREPGRDVRTTVAGNVHVKGDSVLLGAVVQNLLENAWKFTSRRENALIEFGAEGENGTTTCWVRDNGAGFDMTYEKKLFSPFQRLHKASEFPGTGVGLASVQRIIHRHGGQIWATGVPEKGATFTFTLESAS